MDRRTLLKSLVGGGGVAAGPLVVHGDPRLAVGAYPTYNHPFYDEGFRVHWSGWKASPEHNWLVGQWFAWPERGPDRTPDPAYYYVNVPGMQGSRYDPGAYFNLTMRSGQFYVYPETSEHEKDRLIWVGYQHLLAILRADDESRLRV